MSCQILSWNINGLRSLLSKSDSMRELISKNAQILCFQEIKAKPEQVAEMPGLEDYEKFWYPANRPGYSGTMTLIHRDAPKPIATQLGTGVEEFDVEGRVLISEFSAFYLLNIYIPNGADRHDFKMRFLDHFYLFCSKLKKKKPLILTGDFNIAHRAIDIHDPVRLDGESGFKPEERDWMSRFLDLGLIDSFRAQHGEKPEHYTWWSYRQGARQRNKGWRIDYFAHSTEFSPMVEEMQICDSIKGSDHCPLTLKVRKFS